jgi:hypothetical protein
MHGVSEPWPPYLVVAAPCHVARDKKSQLINIESVLDQGWIRF